MTKKKKNGANARCLTIERVEILRKEAQNMAYNQFLIIEYRVLKDKRLSPNEKILYSYFLSWFRQDQYCNASNTSLSKTLGMSSRQVIRSIYKLFDLGFIDIDQQINFRWIKPRKTINELYPNLDNLFDSVYDKIRRK